MRGKEIITKLIIPGAIAMIICLIVHPMCMNGEILDWRKLLLFVGIPFGIQKMFLLVVPRNVGTGEMLGFDVALRSKVHKQVFVTITEMPLSAFDDLGIKFGDKVSLNDIVVTYSQVGSGEAKLFASSISKVGGQPQVPKQPKPEQHNDQK